MGRNNSLPPTLPGRSRSQLARCAALCAAPLPAGSALLGGVPDVCGFGARRASWDRDTSGRAWGKIPKSNQNVR
eukprot:14707697-Alexandrium_andersonii.AAC.1